jgi:hypothetical protein
MREPEPQTWYRKQDGSIMNQGWDLFNQLMQVEYLNKLTNQLHAAKEEVGCVLEISEHSGMQKRICVIQASKEMRAWNLSGTP